jgi:NADH-quinone oxidoreductase subunit L
VLAAAVALDVVERRALDAAVDAIARAGVTAAGALDWLERRGIDAAVDGVASAVGRAGDDLRRLQTGRLHEYLRGAMLGAAALLLLITLTTVA